MSEAPAKGHIDRRFRLLVLDLPSVFGGPEADLVAVCERIERLLDREVRVVFVARGDIVAFSDTVCRRVLGLSRVLLFVWTFEGALYGYDQWGQRVTLAEGGAGDATEVLVRQIAEPAGIAADRVLVLGEDFGPEGRDRVFAGEWFRGSRLLAPTAATDLPEGVERVPPGLTSILGTLDSVLWLWK